tara:strand:+ start:582 stop:779 length:198 start_codon:yes stop_codon:yes gene_type:complete
MEQENREAIIRIEGKLELLDQKLTNLKDNHLFHVEKDIRQLKTFIWFIGTTVFLQMCYLIVRTLI